MDLTVKKQLVPASPSGSVYVNEIPIGILNAVSDIGEIVGEEIGIDKRRNDHADDGAEEEGEYAEEEAKPRE